jgi:serine/threonine-protein kinase PknG
MTVCAQSGCDGHIDEDGFCDICGRPPTVQAVIPASAVPSSTGPTPPTTTDPSAARHGDPCPRPGCEGMIDDGGYCDICGHSGSALTPTPAPAVPSGGPAPSSSTASATNTLRAGSTSGPATGRTSGSALVMGSRGELGAGLVEVPSIPRRDPLSVVMTDPEVPERKRTCARCGEPVGRKRGSRPPRTEGFCPSCGARFSFSPKLGPGDLIKGQYKVAGCLAHGGLGWIYLAQNLNLSDRQGYLWVVLKGLLDSEDESAMAAAVAERQFLTEVQHPNIVQIYDFVEHEGAGYIVMAYVGGESLREIRLRYLAETNQPLPPAQAIAYILGILPAFEYLHRRSLLFCDFKPDNVIHTEDRLTLIDLGGVVAIGEEGDVYGTVGYQAPEIADVGPSIASDLYTVGRTLAVLSIAFAGAQDRKRYAYTLPPASDVELFTRYEAFHLFLLKATAPDPAARFASASEMAQQLLGVLRQVRAIDGEEPRPAPSLLFSTELGNGTEGPSLIDLPVPAVDPFDPSAAVLLTVAAAEPDQVQAALAAAPRSPEVVFRVARAHIEAGDLVPAGSELDSLDARGGGWRLAWWRGVLQLAAGEPALAQSYFAAVAGELPGELAPRLAGALAAELSAGDDDQRAGNDGERHPVATSDLLRAAANYAVVAATDPGLSSASFGLARVLMALGDRAGAVAALRGVPGSSSSYVAAQTAECRARCAELEGRGPGVEDLAAASDLVGRLRADPAVRLGLTRDLHTRTLTGLLDGSVGPDADLSLAGVPLTEEGVRSGLETTYRALARLAHDDEERVALVDLANLYRPRTLT